MNKAHVPNDYSNIEGILSEVKDPEIPVISIRDLGILQSIEILDDRINVKIIPTYSGCPAMYAIKEDIQSVMIDHGYQNVSVELINDPIWNTDMISDKGKEAMLAYGIVPPLTADEKIIKCPQCGSNQTECISEFGSTACKSLYRCTQCLEPFDYFKCHA